MFELNAWASSCWWKQKHTQCKTPAPAPTYCILLVKAEDVRYQPVPPPVLVPVPSAPVSNQYNKCQCHCSQYQSQYHQASPVSKLSYNLVSSMMVDFVWCLTVLAPVPLVPVSGLSTVGIIRLQILNNTWFLFGVLWTIVSEWLKWELLSHLAWVSNRGREQFNQKSKYFLIVERKRVEEKNNDYDTPIVKSMFIIMSCNYRNTQDLNAESKWHDANTHLTTILNNWTGVWGYVYDYNK